MPSKTKIVSALVLAAVIVVAIRLNNGATPGGTLAKVFGKG